MSSTSAYSGALRVVSFTRQGAPGPNRIDDDTVVDLTGTTTDPDYLFALVGDTLTKVDPADLVGRMPWEEAPALSTNPANAASNSSLLPTAWDAAATAGKALAILTPGTYYFNAFGTTTKYCLTPGDKTKFYALWIGPGVHLKLANNQISDGQRLGFVYFAGQSGGGYVGWPFGSPTGRGQGGRVSCNTANQSGWTTNSGEGGTRFTQGVGSSCVWINDTTADGSVGITVDNVVLDDCFGCPISGWANESEINYGAGESQDWTFTRIKSVACVGAGITFSYIDKFHVAHAMPDRV
jgi:hypothetical protein